MHPWSGDEGRRRTLRTKEEEEFFPQDIFGRPKSWDLRSTKSHPKKNLLSMNFKIVISKRSGICIKCDISNLSFVKMFARALLQCWNIAGWTAMVCMTPGSLCMLLKGVVQDSISRSRWASLAGVADGEIRF